jgi:nucleoside-diphosphate-sugar epimerase
MDLSDYSVIVTGSSGFLGQWLIRHLLRYSTSVLGVDLHPFPNHEADPYQNNPIFTFIRGDINDTKFLSKIFKRLPSHTKRRRAVYHLSGLSHVKLCQADPLKAYNLNVLQTVKLLEACRKENITRFVYPSSALVYGENHTHLITENDAVDPQNIYASSKLAAEMAIQIYGKYFGFSCDIARFSNIYGYGSNPDTAVATALSQAEKGQKINLKSYAPVRDFIYCADAVEGLIRLLDAGNDPGCRIFNVSTGVGLTVGEMVETLCRIVGIQHMTPNRSKNKLPLGSKLILSNLKLYNRTGWKPTYSLEEGLYEIWKTIKKQEK